MECDIGCIMNGIFIGIGLTVCIEIGMYLLVEAFI